MTTFAVIALTAVLAAGAGAVRAEAVDAGHTRTELVSEAAVVAPGAPFWVLWHLAPDPGWHTYWRNPGDSGIKPNIEWHLPAGFEAGTIRWPVPARIPYGPLVNYGYDAPVYLPVKITPPDDLTAGDTVTLAADARWLVCEEICIPEEASLSLTLKTADAPRADPGNAAAVDRALARLPAGDAPADYAANESVVQLDVALPERPPGGIADAVFFPATNGAIENAGAQAWRETADGVRLQAPRGPGDIPTPFAGVIKVMGGDERAVGYAVAAQRDDDTIVAVLDGPPAASGAGETPAAAAGIGFARALFFALLGGLILNLMPCVFPVLSIKALALARHGEMPAAERRLEGIFYTLGILASFGAVAGLLMILRAGGEAIGWGFQLQSPVFVTVMALILFAMGLSFSGLFTLGGGIADVGQSLTEKRGHSGAFFTGVLACIVATPCTAPFMAAALGFALTQPPVAALLLFLTLGFGLALPILALSFSPALAHLLPRPGGWMETFRQFLAFLLYATVVWLLWVLGRQIGVNAVALALAGLVLVAFIVWLVSVVSARGPAGRILRGLSGVAAGAALVFVVLSIARHEPVSANQTAPAGPLAAEPYSAERLARYRQAGQPVFVNFTADWCITCLVNERALMTTRVITAFKAHNVRYLKGDWTNRDPDITAVLERFGRSGVPLYLYYSGDGGADEPRILPQILTPGTLVETVAGEDDAAG